MLNQGGDTDSTPLTDSLVAAIASSAGVVSDAVSITVACDDTKRRAMSLTISFSITLQASDLSSPAVTTPDNPSDGGFIPPAVVVVNAAELVGSLNDAVASGEFAASLSAEAEQRGQVVAVVATVLESNCLTCGVEEVSISTIEVSGKVYMGTLIMLLPVAILLFIGQIAILVDSRRTKVKAVSSYSSGVAIELSPNANKLQSKSRPSQPIDNQDSKGRMAGTCCAEMLAPDFLLFR